jgi:hypothetical protein
MALMIHVVWVDSAGLPELCLAGPMGDDQRALMDIGARLIATIEAASHFEAMTKYNRLLDREAYTTDFDWDYKEYPDEWHRIQAESHR